jgi:hypothetical protein
MARGVGSLGPIDVVNKNLGVGGASLVIAGLAEPIRDNERVGDLGEVKNRCG